MCKLLSLDTGPIRQNQFNNLPATCFGFQESRLTLLTFEMWTPSPLWIPEHRMQTKMPKFHTAHRGPEKLAMENYEPGFHALFWRSRNLPMFAIDCELIKRDQIIWYFSMYLWHRSPRSICYLPPEAFLRAGAAVCLGSPFLSVGPSWKPQVHFAYSLWLRSKQVWSIS